MKEQLVSFETAKLAKELGFDIDCLQAYNIWRENIRKTDTEESALESIQTEEELNYEGRSWSTVRRFYQSKAHTLAPTQSLLQKWMRMKFGIYAYIDYINMEAVIVDYRNHDGKEILRLDVHVIRSDWEVDEDIVEELLKRSLKIIKNNESTR